MNFTVFSNFYVLFRYWKLSSCYFFHIALFLGDSLALITEGKALSTKSISKSNQSAAPTQTFVQNDENAGLNAVVKIKKSAKSSILSPIKKRDKNFANGTPNDNAKQRQLFRKSLLVEEELAEIADTLGG